MFRTLLAVLLIAGVSVAQAQTRKAGLWENTITVNFSQGGPQLSPEQLEKMKQMGIQLPFGGKPMVQQICVTPEMAARHELPRSTRAQDGCKVAGSDPTGNPVTAEMVCDGDLKGKGSVKVFHDSDTAYRGAFEFTGTDKRGQPISMKTSFSGRWLASDCAGVAPLAAPQ